MYEKNIESKIFSTKVNRLNRKDANTKQNYDGKFSAVSEFASVARLQGQEQTLSKLFQLMIHSRIFIS